MRVPFYDLPAQWQELRPEIDDAILAQLASGAYMLGPEHKAFEEEMALRHGVAHAIAVANGTDALRIAMDTIGIGPGDEVITVGFTFVSSVETIVQTGATPVLVEIDPATFMIDPTRIEEKVGPRTKAILPVHLFGGIAPMGPIGEIAERHALHVLEDAAQAIGALSGGRAAGSFGIAATLSFYPTKNLGAAGDAGMILTDDDEVAAGCRSRRIHGMGRERYAYDHLGYTSRLDEVQALILRRKLARLPDWDSRRREIASRYLAEMRGPTLPSVPPGDLSSWHQFAILTDRRDELQTFLKAREIDAMIYYPVPLHLHAPYRHLGVPGSLPVTERVCREVLCLPIQPHLSDDQVAWTIESVNAFFAG